MKTLVEGNMMWELDNRHGNHWNETREKVKNDSKGQKVKILKCNKISGMAWNILKSHGLKGWGKKKAATNVQNALKFDIATLKLSCNIC